MFKSSCLASSEVRQATSAMRLKRSAAAFKNFILPWTMKRLHLDMDKSCRGQDVDRHETDDSDKHLVEMSRSLKDR